MTQTEQITFIESLNAESMRIMLSKGHDYAGEDVLKNFKQMRKMCEILEVDVTTEWGVHLFYILLKIQRAANLIQSGKNPMNESVQDSLKDLRNYVTLAMCSLEEERAHIHSISNQID